MTVAIDRDQAFLDAVRRIADEVAAPNADVVDREAQFPTATIDALKTEGALSAFVPTEADPAGRPAGDPARRFVEPSADPSRILAAHRDQAVAGRHVGSARHARDVLSGLRRPAEFPTDQVLPTPFSAIAPESMVPVSHILWSHLWLGIATDAFDRARAFVRAAAKGGPGRRRRRRSRLSHLHERARAAARRGRTRGCATSRSLADAGSGAAVDDGDDPALQQPEDRRLGAGAARSARGRSACTASSASRTTRRSASVATCATRCPPALMVANERIHQTNASLLLIAKDV